jgi:uncharacterized SAM-binding protein YcdF (DUF218 family)
MASGNHPPTRKRWKKLRIFLGICLGILLLSAVMHRPILRGIGHFLIVQDALRETPAIFVLSGNSLDRGKEAAKLYHQGWAPRIVCLGGEPHSTLELYGIHDLGFEMTKRVLLEEGVPNSAIDSLPEGTSTFEEFVAIERYCKQHRLQQITVVSSLFHTRRIDEFFRLRLHLQGIEIVLRGADESMFEEDAWWKAEPGLLFVNSEYIKLLYYWTRY